MLAITVEIHSRVLFTTETLKGVLGWSRKNIEAAYSFSSSFMLWVTV